MVKEELGNLISQKEAAEMRGVSLAAISDLIKRGKLTAVEVGGRKFLRRREVVNYEPSKGGRPSKKSSATKASQKKGTAKKRKG